MASQCWHQGSEVRLHQFKSQRCHTQAHTSQLCASGSSPVKLGHLISLLGELNELTHFPVHVLPCVWDIVSTQKMLAAVIASERVVQVEVTAGYPWKRWCYWGAEDKVGVVGCRRLVKRKNMVGNEVWKEDRGQLTPISKSLGRVTCRWIKSESLRMKVRLQFLKFSQREKSLMWALYAKEKSLNFILREKPSSSNFCDVLPLCLQSHFCVSNS